ncbi:hypothetical protein ACWDRB_55550 [Nonomuraea sp. NPDC003707]
MQVADVPGQLTAEPLSQPLDVVVEPVEAKRQAVDRWIRAGAYDAVIEYDAGAQARAAAVPLRLLRHHPRGTFSASLLDDGIARRRL